jgi:hypothetical protein
MSLDQYNDDPEGGAFLKRRVFRGPPPARGPFIEQDVTRLDRSMLTSDLQASGAGVERVVLSRAVQWHAEDRVIRSGNQTIVFP